MLQSLVECVLPRRCAYCNQALNIGVFCTLCSELFAFVTPELCHDNATPAAFVYGGLLRDMLIKAKFQNDTRTGRLLIRHFQFCIDNNLLALPSPQHGYDAVSYVPTHWARRLRRTHDFPALFARALSSSMRVPFLTTLRCMRRDPPLSSLKSADLRQNAVTGRYKYLQTNASAARILLVDDVVTTGTTLAICAKLLEDQGHQVSTFAFAKTPLIRSDAEIEVQPSFAI